MARGAEKRKIEDGAASRNNDPLDQAAKVSQAVVKSPEARPKARSDQEAPLLPPAVEQWLREQGATVGIALFLVVATFAVYGQTFGFDFVSYGDNEYVYENNHVKEGLSLDSFLWAFTGMHASNWHPLTTISHLLDWSLYGGSAGWHHFTNVLLHAAGSVVLFLALRRLTGATWRSGLVAALFCLHPLHVESVAWISQRKDVLAGLFFGLTLWSYAAYAEQEFSWPRYLRVVAMFVLGLLSNPILVTVPLVLLLLDYWPLGRWQGAGSGGQGEGTTEQGAGSGGHGEETAGSRSSLFVEKVPLFALSAASGVVAYLVQKSAGELPEAVGPLLRLQTILLGYARYLKLLVWPFDLAVDYPRDREVLLAATVMCGLALLAVSAVLIACRRRCPYLFVGWFWFLILLAPVSGVMTLGDQAVADRYTYLSLTGLFVSLVWGVAAIAEVREAKRDGARKKGKKEEKEHRAKAAAAAHLPKGATPSPPARLPKGEGGEVPWGAWVVAAVVLGFFSIRSILQASTWSDNEVLYRHALDVSQNSYLCHTNYGVVLLRQNKGAEALEQFNTALRIKPGYYMAMTILGTIEWQRGRLPEAIDDFKKAIAGRPDYAAAHSGLAAAYVIAGKLADAEEESRQALGINPDSFQAEESLAQALWGQHRAEEALPHYRRAVELAPELADLHRRLGEALFQTGAYEEGIAECKKAIELKPDDVDAHHELAMMYHTLGRLQEAFDEWKIVRAKQPSNIAAVKGMGRVLVKAGRGADAIPYLQAALSGEPRDIESRRYLALAYIAAKQADKAKTELREVLKRDPQEITAINTLAWVEATAPDAALRDGKDALELAGKAAALTKTPLPNVLDTMAAAYAEAGRFKEAVETARKAKKAADEGKGRIDGLDARIKLYEAGKPFRDPLLAK
jgi:tetratricopeptide (TPR) repeat protein